MVLLTDTSLVAVARARLVLSSSSAAEHTPGHFGIQR